MKNNSNISRDRFLVATHARNIVIAITLGCFFAFTGLVAAVAPELAIRLIPLFVVPLVLLVALLNSNPNPPSIPFRLVWVTILLMVFALWPSYLLIKVGGLPALDLRRIAAAVSVLLGIYYIAAGKHIQSGIAPTATQPLKTGYWIIGLYAFWRLVSSAGSTTPVASLIQVLWEFLYYYSFFVLGSIFFSPDALRYRVHKTILYLIIFIAAFAIIERVMGTNPLVQFAPSNEEFEATVRAMNLSRIRDGVFRTQSTFEHPLLLSEFAAFAGCFAFAAILWNKMRWLGVLALVSSLLAAYLTGSRSAFVAVGAGLITVLVLRLVSPKQAIAQSRASLRKLSAIAMVALAALFATPAVLLLSQGKNQGEAASTQARVEMLKIGSEAIVNRPILGWGAGSGPVIAGIKTGDGISTMDNYLLSIAIESGLPGILLFSLCFLFPIWIIFNRMTLGTGNAASFLGATAGGLIAVLLMRSILWMPFNLSFTFFISGIALAQCAALAKEQTRES